MRNFLSWFACISGNPHEECDQGAIRFCEAQLSEQHRPSAVTNTCASKPILSLQDFSKRYDTSVLAVLVLASKHESPPTPYDMRTQASLQNGRPHTAVAIYCNPASVSLLSASQASHLGIEAGVAKNAERLVELLTSLEPQLVEDILVHLQRAASGDLAGDLSLFLDASKYPLLPFPTPAATALGKPTIVANYGQAALRAPDARAERVGKGVDARATDASAGDERKLTVGISLDAPVFIAAMPATADDCGGRTPVSRRWRHATVEPVSFDPGRCYPAGDGDGGCSCGSGADGSGCEDADACWPAVIITFQPVADIRPCSCGCGCTHSYVGGHAPPTAADATAAAAPAAACKERSTTYADPLSRIAFSASAPVANEAPAQQERQQLQRYDRAIATAAATGISALQGSCLLGSSCCDLQPPTTAAAGCGNGGLGAMQGPKTSAAAQPACNGGGGGDGDGDGRLAEEGLRLREWMALSGLDSIITGVCVVSEAALYQNAASIEFFGRRLLQPSLPTVAPHRAAVTATAAATAAADPGPATAPVPAPTPARNAAPRMRGILQELFYLEPAKLDRMLSEVCGEGRCWRGIVQVPASCAPLETDRASPAPKRRLLSSAAIAAAAAAAAVSTPGADARSGAASKVAPATDAVDDGRAAPVVASFGNPLGWSPGEPLGQSRKQSQQQQQKLAGSHSQVCAATALRSVRAEASASMEGSGSAAIAATVAAANTGGAVSIPAASAEAAGVGSSIDGNVGSGGGGDATSAAAGPMRGGKSMHAMRTTATLLRGVDVVLPYSEIVIQRAVSQGTSGCDALATSTWGLFVDLASEQLPYNDSSAALTVPPIVASARSATAASVAGGGANDSMSIGYFASPLSDHPRGATSAAHATVDSCMLFRASRQWQHAPRVPSGAEISSCSISSRQSVRQPLPARALTAPPLPSQVNFDPSNTGQHAATADAGGGAAAIPARTALVAWAAEAAAQYRREIAEQSSGRGRGGSGGGDGVLDEGAPTEVAAATLVAAQRAVSMTNGSFHLYRLPGSSTAMHLPPPPLPLPPRRAASRSQLEGGGGGANAMTRVLAFASSLRSTPSAVQAALQQAVAGSRMAAGGIGGGMCGGSRPFTAPAAAPAPAVAAMAAAVPAACSAARACNEETYGTIVAAIGRDAAASALIAKQPSVDTPQTTGDGVDAAAGAGSVGGHEAGRAASAPGEVPVPNDGTATQGAAASASVAARSLSRRTPRPPSLTAARFIYTLPAAVRLRKDRSQAHQGVSAPGGGASGGGGGGGDGHSGGWGRVRLLLTRRHTAFTNGLNDGPAEGGQPPLAAPDAGGNGRGRWQCTECTEECTEEASPKQDSAAGVPLPPLPPVLSQAPLACDGGGGFTQAVSSMNPAAATGLEDSMLVAAAAEHATAAVAARDRVHAPLQPGTCWHEVVASPAVDPVTGRTAIILAQTDVTSKVEAERHIAFVAEAEHRLLEQIFPRHVLTYMTEEDRPAAPGAAGEAAASAASPGAAATALSQPPAATVAAGGGIANGATVAPYCSRQPTAYLRDINRLATYHSEVTLLFADIQGFTPMCKVLEPRVIMSFLNDLFTQFDRRLDEFGVYKIETIGDCYFVAGGLIHEDEYGMSAVRARDSHADPLHAEKVLMFAKAMLAAASCVHLPTTRTPVQLRIGIHTGPVVSGVVGQRMPRFCLFGDTVNTASRMESSGVPGCIHASEAARRRLRNEDWVPTGGIEVKGKGFMNTFLWAPPDSESHLALQLCRSLADNSMARTADSDGGVNCGGASCGTESSSGTAAAAAAAALRCRRQQHEKHQRRRRQQFGRCNHAAGGGAVAAALSPQLRRSRLAAAAATASRHEAFSSSGGGACCDGGVDSDADSERDLTPSSKEPLTAAASTAALRDSMLQRRARRASLGTLAAAYEDEGIYSLVRLLFPK